MTTSMEPGRIFANESTRLAYDTIFDFDNSEEKISLYYIDAKQSTSFNDAFKSSSVGAAGASSLTEGTATAWYDSRLDRIIVEANTGASAGNEVHIELTGYVSLGSSHFIL